MLACLSLGGGAGCQKLIGLDGRTLDNELSEDGGVPPGACESYCADVVREVAHWYLCEAVGLKLIARRLRARQLPTRRGAGWSFTSVRSMLTNPILTGRVAFNRRRMHLNRATGRRVHRAKQESEHLERQDESLRILTDDTFAKIQDRMRRAGRNQSPRAATGIAPFRAFLHERMATRAPGRNWLFFGHQHSRSDFFYEDELAGMKAARVLTRLTLAWSREAEHKIYVQDRMREVGRDLWSWLAEGAHVYVCGDAKRMAKDV